MGAIKLASPEMGMDVEALTNLMFRYYRELEYLLNGNIDSQNVKSLTTDKIIAGEALIGTALIDTLVVGTNVGIGSAPKVFSAQPTTPYRVNDIWIDGTDLKRCTVARSSGAYVATDWGLGTNYTNPTGVTSIVGGVITTDFVNALNITAAHVVAGELVVGTNVAMGTGAVINWGTVTPPNASQVGALPTGTFIPTQYTDSLALAAWENSDYATYIDAYGVYSGSFNGGMFNVNPTGSSTLPSGITIGGWNTNVNAWAGEACRIAFNPTGYEGNTAIVFSGPVYTAGTWAFVPLAFTLPVRFNNTVVFNQSTHFPDYTYVTGDVLFEPGSSLNFHDATVVLPGGSAGYYTEAQSNARFTRPYSAANFCFLDYGSGVIVVRDASGTSLGTITVTP